MTLDLRVVVLDMQGSKSSKGSKQQGLHDGIAAQSQDLTVP